MEMKELQKLQNEIQTWSDATFGKYRLATPMAYHLKKEVDELIEKLESWYKGVYGNVDFYHKNLKSLKSEYADCFMLLIDSAAHLGIDIESLYEAAKEKLEINKNRKWGEADENGVVEHIE